MKVNNFLIPLVLLLPFHAFSQVNVNVTPDKIEEEIKDSRPRKFLNLTIGVEYDEKLPKVPDFISFKGDFRNVTSASYSKEANAIRFVPKKEGISTLTVHDQSGKVVAEYRIDVRKSKLDAVVREMQSLLGDIEGITIRIVNNRVVVDGKVLTAPDMNRVYNVVQQFSDQASSLVALSPMAQHKIAELIQKEINNPEIEVRAVNDKFLLQGIARSEAEKAKAEIIAKAYIPSLVLDQAELDGRVKKPRPANDGIINLLTIPAEAPRPPGKIVQLVIHYVELKKDYNRGFRFEFAPTLGDNSQLSFTSGRSPASGGTGAGGVVSEITATISNLLPRLNWAKSHGHARVLESTSMIVEDGSTGVLKSYTDLPYSTSSATGGTTVQYAKVGLESNITPTILGERSDTIKLNIKFQISALVGFVASAPQIANNQIETLINVRSGQSAAIGGLIRNIANTNFNKPSDRGGSPIIELLASKDFQRNQSQFVTFITPIIKSSASQGSEKIKKKFRLRD